MVGFYARLRDRRQDDAALQACIEAIVNKLEDEETSVDRPGMLLGKIQSGKTRAFLGVVARAFDKGFDIALVLTKGTRTLARQTTRRIASDFKMFIDDEEVNVFDIMEMPERLTRSELRRKLVVVVKKETHNLQRVFDLITETHPVLRGKRILIVDDEADMASVRFVKKKGDDDYSQGAIAQLIDNLRAVSEKVSFLQVTATPYALYLQPEDYSETGFVFFPKRPAFTELLPIHGGYVGGDQYFGIFEPDDLRSYLFVPVPLQEQDALRSGDGRTIRSDRAWSSLNIKVLRRALMTFLLAVVVRRWQQAEQEVRPGKYSMIIHNDTQRAAHQWQWETVELLRTTFEDAAEHDDPRFRALFADSYSDLQASVTASGGRLPYGDQAYEEVKKIIIDGELNVQRVNSDVQLAPLLDPETAELKLRAQANIFIGGSILDRGITVPALIAFYYGRNPKRMQADTVLQHSRMYGNRHRQDLAVTRFYTSLAVYQRLEQIHELETALREAFQSGIHEGGVAFIQNDARNGIVPCAVSKIALSDVVTLRPGQYYGPSEFNTKKDSSALKAFNEINNALVGALDKRPVPQRISIDEAVNLIGKAAIGISLSPESTFDWDIMTNLLKYYCLAAKSDNVRLVVDDERKIDRERSGDKSGRSIVGTALRSAIHPPGSITPTLVLLRQKGTTELNWNAGREFWWPILASPTEAEPCVFSNATASS